MKNKNILNHKNLAVVAFVTFIAMALFSISSVFVSSSAVAKAALNTFTFRVSGDPETLDWNRAHTSVETILLNNLMEGLVSHDASMKVVPRLAEKWKVSLDGKTYTFNLRKDVKWSDGVGLTAKDFVYSWKRLLSPLTAASYAYLLFDIDQAQDFYQGKQKDFSKVGIRAVDNYTFEIRLKEPIAHFIHIPAFWVTFPLREDLVKKYGTSWSKPGNMATVGPFVLSSYDVESKIVLKKNPLYYGSRGNIDQAIGLVVKDDSTALSLYESKKIDYLTDIATLDIKRLEAKGELKVFPYLKTTYLAFRVDQYPIQQKKLRKAIELAIDRSQFPKLLHGHQTPTQSFIPPSLLGGISTAPKYDPVLAKRLYNEAGFSALNPAKVIAGCSNWEKPLTVLQFIQQELKKNLGLELTIQSYDHKTFRSQLDLGAFPMYLNSWSADFPDSDNFVSVFLSQGGNNRTSWKNLDFDAKVLKARHSQIPDERIKLYQESQRLLLTDDAVVVPLYHEPILSLVQPTVKNFNVNPLNETFLKDIVISVP